MTDAIEQRTESEAAIERRIRLVMLLDAAESAGIAPLEILRLHTLAYLANVLAPVWDMPALDGKVLKRQGGPFYPALQQDLDKLVGMGVATISKLTHVPDGMGNWRLEGRYLLNRKMVEPILVAASDFPSQRKLRAFVQELAFALSALSDEELDQAMTEDATYADPLIDFGNVVDFAEWQEKNFSSRAARKLALSLPAGVRATPGEQLHFYVRHLHRRLAVGE